MTTTNVSSLGGVILKRDRMGRVRVNRQRRETLLDEFDRSEMSGAAFAELIGIKYQTFATWRQRRVRERAEAGQPSEAAVLTPVAPMQWAEAVMQPAQARADAGLHVRLDLGATLEVCDARGAMLAAELLRGLAGGLGC